MPQTRSAPKNRLTLSPYDGGVRPTTLALIAVAVAVGSCCVGGGALMLLGASGAEEGAPTTRTTGGLEGEWIDSLGPPEFFRRLREGDRYEALGVDHVGEVVIFHADGSCLFQSIVGQPRAGCMHAHHVIWEDCRWSSDGAEVVLTLGEGQLRAVVCKEQPPAVEPGHVERWRVSRNADGSLAVVRNQPVELHSTFRRVE